MSIRGMIRKLSCLATGHYWRPCVKWEREISGYEWRCLRCGKFTEGNECDKREIAQRGETEGGEG